MLKITDERMVPDYVIFRGELYKLEEWEIIYYPGECYGEYSQNLSPEETLDILAYVLMNKQPPNYYTATAKITMYWVPAARIPRDLWVVEEKEGWGYPKFELC